MSVSLFKQGREIQCQGYRNAHLSEDSSDQSSFPKQRSMAVGCIIDCGIIEVDNNPKDNSWDEKTGATTAVLESMKYEQNRLRSFTNRWPLDFVRPEDLAAVGLFYLGCNDNVQCAFCHGIISHWEEGDEPLQEHARHFPMCPYLLNCDVGNVPISGSNGKQAWQVSSSHAECSPRQPISDGPAPVHSFKPKHPTMGSFDKRLETFRNWPSDAVMTPSELAESGLFYTGVADVVTCFCCGGSMGSWISGDNAWAEHAKHFPDCWYVKCIKGSRFPSAAAESATCRASEASTSSCQVTEPVTSQQSTNKQSDELQEVPPETESSPPPSDEKNLMCKICFEDGRRVVFLPCGHSLACPKCASKLTVCPACRRKIESSMRIYLG